VGEGFSFVHFTFAHCFSFTKFFNFSIFGTSRHLPLPGHHQEDITLHHPFSHFPQRAYNHFIDVTELCLFCIFFFHSNRSVQKCDLFLFKILKTKLQTDFLGRYRTKLNTVLESKAAFVHLSCIVHSALLRGRTRNSRERKLCLPHSYCK
jgi:hypothetical protein